MNDLIKIQPQNIGGQTIETVNARDLHGFLESRQDFSDWIKNRIQQYGFVEGVDYLIHKFMEQLPSGAKQKIDYHIAIDMAKELAMVERNEKGRQARQYFIECERRLKQQQPTASLSHVETDLRAIGVVADILRASESSKLGMVRTYCEQHAPRLLPVLPVYAIDKPSDSQGDSSQPTVPISKIVDGITSAKRANLALCTAGLLEQRFREKSDGSQKSFWSITEKGESYGKNLVSPSNSRETQPHWYDCKSDEIAKIVIDNLDKV